MNQIFSGVHEEMAQLLKSQSPIDLIAGGERSCLNDHQQTCNMEVSDSPVTAKCLNFLERIQFFNQIIFFNHNHIWLEIQLSQYSDHALTPENLSEKK